MTSRIYPGQAREVEERFRRHLDGDLALLHKHAQRIMWGILLADKLALDVDAHASRLVRDYPNEFVSHLLAGVVHRWRKRDVQANESLSRARELVAADHPWAYLVPDDARWRCEMPAATLVEVEAGRVYRLVGESRQAHMEPFATLSHATFVRLRSGNLVCINAVQMSDAAVAQVAALGEVTHIIAPSKYHNTYLLETKQHFPRAEIWGVPGQIGYPVTANVPFTGFLDDAKPLFPGEIDHVAIEGVDIGDVWFVDRASRTLIVTDAVFFPRHIDAAIAGNVFTDLYAWAWGVVDRPTVPSYQPLMWMDMKAFQHSLRRALDLEFDHVAAVHGSWRTIEGDARTVLERDLGWVLEMSKLKQLGHIANFVGRHPQIFWRFLQLTREQAKAKRALERVTASGR